MTTPAIREAVARICVELVDQGKLIEAGWQAMRLTSMADDAPQIQVNEMRMAYFAGAQHLFGSIMDILEPGDTEPTEKDLRRMDAISRELNAFVEEFKLRHAKPQGHG